MSNQNAQHPITALLLTLIAVGLVAAAPCVAGAPARLESPSILVEVDRQTGNWSLLDKRSGVRWPAEGEAGLGSGRGLEGAIRDVHAAADAVRVKRGEATVQFSLADRGRSLAIRYEGEEMGEVRTLQDALALRAADRGYLVVPCREGLLIPADSGVAFRRVFGASEYEGCHMNMVGLVKNGSALVASWDGACTWVEVESRLGSEKQAGQRITTTFDLRPPCREIRLTPLSKGDWNTIAAGYREIAEEKGFVVTLREKIQRNPQAKRLVGAANVKLWTCLARRMNEESTQEESVNVRWTFDEAAAIAEHLRRDLGISRCLFTLGGWTEGGYDCRHPDNLPANPECGGNQALAAAVRRIQDLGYVACLHDNYQDMYRDAKSWNPELIEKRPDGSLIQGGRWLGGRAYMVCAPKQLEMAMRPQNLPGIHELFHPWCYFIDTTYAVGPRECADPRHPIGRNDDIAWKIKLSDKARELFGLFGSECGREWALPHSDFFEGLVGVSGRYYHNLKPASLGATVIPFWEMVYHDCQICYGKYGYSADQAAEYVAHNILCARPLNYHSIPDHRYWLEKAASGSLLGDRSCFARTDQGWAEGLHPADAFLKTTQEVLGPLHAATAHARLDRLELLGADHFLRRATYGRGAEATTVVVNFGTADAIAESRWGGRTVLPPWGFVIDSPRFSAFYARSWNGRDYPEGSLFTIQASTGDNLDQAAEIRIFHGFGSPKIDFRGASYEVRRELTVQPRSKQPVEAATKPSTTADAGPVAAAKKQPGFKLEGIQWSYRDESLSMDGILLKPEGKGPFPAMLISHGLGGSAQSFGLSKAREMVRWGLVCIAPNYTHQRGALGPGTSPGAKSPDWSRFGASEENTRRARQCIEILQGLPYVDKNRIGAYGHSMGGFVTIGLAAAAPEGLKAAAISGSGVAPRAGFPAPSIEVAQKVRVPFLILHGSADRTVRPEQSATFQQILEKNRVPNERRVFEGEGHPIDQTRREEVFALLHKWFATYLKLPEGDGRLSFAAPSAASRRPAVPAPGEPEWVKEPMQARNTRYATFQSPTIGREVSYLIYLPSEYERSPGKRFPVMYWLHGIGGAQTGLPRYIDRLDEAIQAGKAPPMIVVFVNGVRDSFYCDSADGRTPVETVIIKDLIPHIDKTYRTIAGREGRIVEGFSMGGFGAAHLGFKYPELFCAVSLLDAALLDVGTMERRHSALYQRIFGGRPERFEAENPRTLIEKNAAAIRGRTAIRFAVGALVEGNQSFHQQLTRLGIAHDYDAFEGVGHNHAGILDRLGDKNWAFYRGALGASGTQPER